MTNHHMTHLITRALANQARYSTHATLVCLAGPLGWLVAGVVKLEPSWVGFPIGFAAAFVVGAVVVVGAEGKGEETA